MAWGSGLCARGFVEERRQAGRVLWVPRGEEGPRDRLPSRPGGRAAGPAVRGQGGQGCLPGGTAVQDSCPEQPAGLLPPPRGQDEARINCPGSREGTSSHAGTHTHTHTRTCQHTHTRGSLACFSPGPTPLPVGPSASASGRYQLSPPAGGWCGWHPPRPSARWSPPGPEGGGVMGAPF